ncbi:MAG: hypothetical protein ACPGVP_03000 [Thiolinea sp.]
MDSSTITTPVSASVKSSQDDPDLERLRRILLGKDYQDLLALKQQLENPQQHSEKVAAIVSEALAIRAAQDDSLRKTLSPTIEGALVESVERDPQRLANALYPVMGPAIRKSINEVLTQSFDAFNQVLEQSLSPKSLLWRFDAWRSGRSYAEIVLLNTLEYQVEQVFLIHTETGLLLRHAVSPQAMSKDPDMVSGMLTAIQDFIADSFGIKQGDTLKHMRLGELTVLVEQGPYAVLAAVVRGNPPADLSSLLGKTVEDVHQQMSHTLQRYQGDSEPFVRIHPLLEKCLLTQAQEKKQKKPWLMYLLLTGCLSGLIYWGYQSYLGDVDAKEARMLQQSYQQEWQHLIAMLRAEPGVVIIEATHEPGQQQIRGLLDPLAKQPEVILNTFAASLSPVSAQKIQQTKLAFKPYASTEEKIVLQRARQILQPPADIALSLQEGVLAVSGLADYHWQAQLQASWSGITGVRELNTDSFTATGNPDRDLQRQIDTVSRKIEDIQHYFDNERDVISTADRRQLVKQARHIRQLMADVKQQGRLLEIIVLGNVGRSNEISHTEESYRLAMRRADEIRQQLMMFGVPGVVLTSIVNKYVDADQHSVSYQVNLY